jgi:hypothetical protein
VLTKTAAMLAHHTSIVTSGWLATSPYMLDFQHPAAWFATMLAAVVVALEFALPGLPWLGRGIVLLLATLLLIASPFSLGFAREWAALESDYFIAALLLLSAWAMLRHAWAEARRRELLCSPASRHKDQP